MDKKTGKILLIVFVGLSMFLLNSCKSNNDNSRKNKKKDIMEKKLISYNDQIKIFASLGYKFSEGVTKEMILRDVYEMTWDENTEKHLESNPFSVLYYFYGWRDPKVANYNYSNKCIWFDLEFFDPNSQYKWFMERMGVITNGEIKFTDIEIQTDNDNYEWIDFKVNGKHKRWMLEKAGNISDAFVQRFSYLPKELKTRGKYTYFDNGGQQWVIDYATEKEQENFINKTGLKREWLGEGNHFSEPE